MTTQPDLFTAPPQTSGPAITEAEISDFVAHLMSHGWQTRGEIHRALCWDERKIRAVAQTLGGKVIRCQLGYKLTAQCGREDLTHMQQAANAAGSQSRIQRAYELEVLRAIHAIVGNS